MANKEKDEKQDVDSKEGDTASPSSLEKEEKKKDINQDGSTKDKKKKFDFLRLLYLLLIIGLCIISVLYIRHVSYVHYGGPPPDTDDQLSRIPGILPYYANFIIYPSRIVKEVGIAVFLVLVTIYLCLDLILFEKLKGWKKALSVILSLLVIFGTTEYVMGYFARIKPVMNRPHPTLFWETSPNLLDVNMGPAKVMTNSHGFRSPEISRKKPQGQYRVMVLGDSSAFGHFVKNDETFGAVLAKKLRKKNKGKDIRLINAAVLGYTTYQARTFLKERGWQFSPDMLIIAFNDDPQMEWKSDRERVPPGLLLPVFRLLYKSHIYLSLKKYMLNRRLKRDHSFAVQPGRGKEKNRVSKTELKENLDYILREAKKRNIQVIIVSMPLQSISYDIINYRSVMKEKADNYGFLFLDLLREWNKKYPSHEVFLDIMHPTAQGHKVLAEDLYNMIVENDLIK